MNYGSLTISRSQFIDNSAFQGGVLNALQQCSVGICDSFSDHNVVESEEVPQKAAGSVIIIGQTCKLNIIRSVFNNNKANIGGVLKISSEVELTIINSTFNRNQAIQGGVISTYHSIVTFYNSCSLCENIAVDGGALYATSDSVLNMYDELQLWYNTGNHSGGGINLYHSKLNCYYNGSTLKL